ncbi:MAG TPA: FtsX-like permease family protein [Anaerolineales bacterium]|nr:FtsX-like permease family protein [Anaerolineales bacterium]
MGVIWHKIWFDIWHNKTRTLLAVLSIAAGVFAVGSIFGMSDMMLANMDASHQAVLPTHINAGLETLADRETLLSLREVPGVEDIEPYNSVNVLYKLRPEDEWRQGVIQMRDNYEQQKYELLQLRGGHWPNSKNDLAVERMGAQSLNIGIGDSVIFKIDEKERVLPITGFIRHPFVPPPQFMDLAFFFVNGEGMERLGIPDGKFGGFYVRVTPYSEEYAREVATSIKDKLAKQNINVAAFQYEDPNKHWGRTYLDAMTQVQQLLALICVVIGAILVFNTISNLITQQTNQIGILKAIGGRMPTIVGMYLVSALVYGTLAFLIALPLGAIVAHYITKLFLNLFNIDYDTFNISRNAVILQAFCALLAPLLAGLPPILQGAAITVRQAIASYGLGGGYRSGRLDRVVESVGARFLPSHYATALGNMFRHKGRLILTQVVLIVAGASFLMVMSLNSSLDLTLDNYFGRLRYDTRIYFSSLERGDQIMSLAGSVPGVEKVELDYSQQANLFLEGQQVKDAGLSTNIRGIRAGSDIYEPLIVAGRWLSAQDIGRIVVIPRQTAEDYEISVGDMITLDLGVYGEDQWQVIGLYEPVFVGGFASANLYAPMETLYKISKKHNRASQIMVRTTAHDEASVTTITKNLKDVFEQHSLKVAASTTQLEARATNEWQFSLVTSMLLALSIIVAIVGGIALMGALSIGVIERTKEIGVLRAIGARSHTILGIFIMEGVLQGLVSWLIAIPLSILVSPFAASAMGKVMFGATLDYQYNWLAVFVWLGIVVAISIFASMFPARGATRISVRDSLAYA